MDSASNTHGWWDFVLGKNVSEGRRVGIDLEEMECVCVTAVGGGRDHHFRLTVATVVTMVTMATVVTVVAVVTVVTVMTVATVVQW
jgi:hypothetical protein